MVENVLKKAGFEEKEAKIYHTLLQLGPSSASQVGAELGYDRTTTYYILLRMLEKGFVSEIIKNQTKTFSATNPEDLLKDLEERNLQFAKEVPKLQELFNQHSEMFNVEVRQGNAGMRFLYKDAIKKNQEVLGLGIDDSQYMSFDNVALSIYYRNAEAHKMKERFLTHKHAKTFGSKISTYRYLDEKYFQPTPTFIYGKKIVLLSWKPTLRLIFIESEEIAESFKKHFEALWKIAKIK